MISTSQHVRLIKSVNYAVVLIPFSLKTIMEFSEGL